VECGERVRAGWRCRQRSRCSPRAAVAVAAPPPPPPPPPGPPPTLVQPPNPAYSRHLEWTGAGAAHAAGLSGAGIRIGVIDTGVNRNHPALRGRVVANLNYVNPNTNNLGVDDVVGHGTAVAQTIAGTAFGQWPGGIAPGAEILSARIINDAPPEDDGSGRGNEVSGALGLAPIHNDLSARGMRIMNNSWGGLYWNNPNATNPIAAEYRDFVHNRDGLVVFSAGNSGFANPSDTAALPSQPGSGGSRPAADLERGWLTVVALDRDNRGQLADYSNACGIAIRYCLAAPGSVVVTGTDDAPNNPDYWIWSGTSFAAPIVSGAAALVWEAFPYFDNDLVRQTLLGTATDLGAPGPDAVFGYGMVNIERAVNGPGLLDWGDVTVDFDAITSTWGNELTGAGRVVKRGSGTLILDDFAFNGGGLDVQGGTLHAMRSVYGDIDVGVQGRFVLGNGAPGWEMAGNLDNAGHVELISREVASTLTLLRGDYRHRSTATLGLDLGHVLSIMGSAQIDGGTLHLTGVMSGYTATARQALLFADQGINGEFDRLSWADSLFLEGALGYDTRDVWLDITRLNVAATAQAFGRITPAAASAAVRVEQAFAAIDRSAGQGNTAHDEFLRVAGQFQQLRDQAAALDALERLSGQAHARALDFTFDGIDQHRRALSARLADADAPGAWRQALGGGLNGDGWSRSGWLMGHDARLGSGQSVAGFAFGETRAEGWPGTARERAHARQTHGQLYLGRVSPTAYLTAQLGLGRMQRGIERHPFAGNAVWQGVYSRASGRYGSLGAEAGGRFAIGAARLSPYLGIALDWLQQDGFEESGASGFGLRAEAARLRRSQAIVGVRMSGAWRGLGVNGYAEWQRALAADGFAVPASFTGMDSLSPLPQSAAARSGGVFGLALDAPISRQSLVAFTLDQRAGPRGSERGASLRYLLGF